MYRIYTVTPSGLKHYLDRTFTTPVNYRYAEQLARENASAMPNRRIYIEHAVSGKLDSSVINIDSVITSRLH